LAAGYVDAINSMACARTSCALGAGRTKWGDQIDYAVGLELLVAAGSNVKKGKKGG
jgi:thymidine phosphorylase